LGGRIESKKEGAYESDLRMRELQFLHNERDYGREIEPVQIKATIDYPQKNQNSITGLPRFIGSC
jgi:hypothetical protein